MKKCIYRRWLACVLAMVMVLGMTSGIVLAEEPEQEKPKISSEAEVEIGNADESSEVQNELRETSDGFAVEENMSDEITIEATSEVNLMPEFFDSVTIDDVTITASAEAGVFPQGATLFVQGVEEEELESVESLLQEKRDTGAVVARSYVFDIKVLDVEGVEVQPHEGQHVDISFETQEVSDINLDAQIYHIADNDAEKLETVIDGDVIQTETDGFSFYTVEFTYDKLQYVMEGDTSIPPHIIKCFLLKIQAFHLVYLS